MFIVFLLKPNNYLDPGTGSILIQIILAGILGVGVAVRIYWKKIKGWVNRNKLTESEEIDPTDLPKRNDTNI